MWPHGVVRVNWDSPQSNGLIHWWPTTGQNSVGGTLYDLVGGLNGALGAGTLRSREALLGGALEFDGGSDAPITCDTFDPPDSVSIALWMRAPTLGASRERFIGTSTAFELVIDTSNPGKLGADLFEGGGGAPVSSFRVDDNIWRHFVVTHDASHNVAIYINGVLDASGTTDGTDPGAGALSIGARTGSSDYFNGHLADIRIYNRVLSASEAAQMYAPGTRWELYQTYARRFYNVASSPPVVKVIDETEAASEASLRPRVMLRLLAEALSMPESILRPRSMLRTLGETVAGTEARQSVIGFVRLIGETVAASEAKNTIYGYIRLIAETLAESEATMRARTLARITGDTVASTETTLRPRVLARLIAETAAIAEAIQRTPGLVKYIADTMAVPEAALRPRVMLRTIAETVAESEAIGRLMAMMRSAADTVAVTEAAARVRALRRIITNAVALVDGLSVKKTVIRFVSESVGPSEAIRIVPGLVRWVGDTVAITTSTMRNLFVAFSINVKRTIVRFLG